MISSGLKKKMKAFTIIELLIAIIIIGILVAVIIPRLATRSELARIRAAQTDLEHLRNAEERAGIDTGYYYRLYVLDDNPGGDGIGTGQTDDVNDGLRDEVFNTVADNPIRMYINVSTGELYNDTSSIIIYNKMVENETAFNWNGRYITWNQDFNQNDIPDDPWNHDYLFFTIEGLVLEPDGIIIDSCTVDSNGDIVAGGDYDCRRFDRFTMLSLGPDGLPGNGLGTDFGTGDDIIQQW